MVTSSGVQMPRWTPRRVAIAVVLGALAAGVILLLVMVVGGVLVGTLSSTTSQHRFTLVVENDVGRTVTVQPCARYECGPKIRAAFQLDSGQSRRFNSGGADTDVHSFVISDGANGRILGCLGQMTDESHGLEFIFRVSQMQECVT